MHDTSSPFFNIKAAAGFCERSREQTFPVSPRLKEEPNHVSKTSTRRKRTYEQTYPTHPMSRIWWNKNQRNDTNRHVFRKLLQKLKLVEILSVIIVVRNSTMAASEGRRHGQLQVALHISLIPAWKHFENYCTGTVVQQYRTITECILLLSSQVADLAVYYWLKHFDKTKGSVTLFYLFYTVGLQDGLSQKQPLAPRSHTHRCLVLL